MQLISYQLGSVLFLCALLMYGTLSGFLPKIRISPAIAMCLAVAGLGAAAWFYLPQINFSFWRESPAPGAATSSPSLAPAVPKAAKRPQRTEIWHTIVVEPVPQASEHAAPNLEPNPEPKPAAEPVDSKNNSPYDSKIKHVAKSVSRFLHRHND